MSLITDIPIRDGEEGDVQLIKLRSYLKDREVEYTYPDQLLIDLLVKNSKESVWRDLTGYSKGIPWGYTTKQPISPETRIRQLTGDTNEEELRYTDNDLNIFLRTIPLRYVVKLINAEGANSVTYPTDDINNPIYIVRKYLGDTDTNNVKYTDAEIVKMLFSSRLDPFAFVAEELSRGAGEAISSSVSSGDLNLASIDGISFEDDETKTQTLEESILYIRAQAVYSVYNKAPIYDFWLNKVSYGDVEWESAWYGV